MATTELLKPVPAPGSPKAPAKGRPVPVGRIALYVSLSVVSLLMVVPFAWMVITSLKTPVEIASQDGGLLPEHWEFGNYVDALKAAPFATYARNSFVIAISHTVLNVLVASMAGYALARIRFRGSETIFYLFVAALMIPTYTKVLPEFLIVRFMPLAAWERHLRPGRQRLAGQLVGAHRSGRGHSVRRLPLPAVLSGPAGGAGGGRPARRAR